MPVQQRKTQDGGVCVSTKGKLAKVRITLSWKANIRSEVTQSRSLKLIIKHVKDLYLELANPVP